MLEIAEASSSLCKSVYMNLSLQNGSPLLHDPASKGFSMICELLLENGANPLSETKTGVSPLYIASKNGHKDVVRILLKFGADATKICAEVVCTCRICTHNYSMT